jgi:hypothetical protein
MRDESEGMRDEGNGGRKRDEGGGMRDDSNRDLERMRARAMRKWRSYGVAFFSYLIPHPSFRIPE